MSRYKEGMIDLSDIGIDEKLVRSIRKVGVIACGTAFHACMVGKYIIERLARIPVERNNLV